MKSTKVLMTRKEKGVPDALIDTCKTERNLEVVRYILDAFGRNTGLKDQIDVLECKAAEELWQKTKSKYDKEQKDMDSGKY